MFYLSICLLENIYTFLKKTRLLRVFTALPRGAKKSLRSSVSLDKQVDWDNSKAMFMKHRGQLFFNPKLPKLEKEKLLEQIVADLKELKDPETGEKIIGRILYKKDLAKGSKGGVPDLYIEPADDTYLIVPSVGYSSKLVSKNVAMSGDHLNDGIICMWGKAINKNRKIKTKNENLVPTILYLMDLKIPKGLDGEIMKEAIRSDFMNQNKPVYGEESKKKAKKYDKEKKGEEEVKKRLEALGYL